MIYKMDLKDSSDTMTFNLLETPIVDKDIEGAVDNVTLDGNQYTDYLYLKKQYIQKWAIMCPDEYDELRGFYTRQFEDGEVPSYRVYYGANVTRDYTLNGDYFQFNAEGIETGMTLSQLLGNTEQTIYRGKNLANLATFADGYVTAGGQLETSIANRGEKYSEFIKVSPSTTYTFTIFATTSTYPAWFGVGEYTSNSFGSFVIRDTEYNESATSITFTTSSTTNYVVVSARNLASATKVQLEQSASATAYEPYVGGTASPNPDYPQPISTVTGEQTVTATGKNLVEESIEANIDSSGKIVADNRFCMNIAQVVQGMTYTATEGEHFVAGFFTSKPSINSTSYDGQRIVVLNERTHTFEAPITGYVAFRSSDGYTMAQLEHGSTPTSYEPYQGQSYEVNLGKNLVDIDSLVTTGVTVADEVMTGTGINIYNAYGQNTDGIPFVKKNGQLAISFKAYTDGNVSTANTNGLVVRVVYTDGTSGLVIYCKNNETTAVQHTAITTSDKDVASIQLTYANDGGNIWHISEFQIEEGSQATSYAPYFTPIELAKIGTYQDRIYKTGGKWYLYKETGKLVLDGDTYVSLYTQKPHSFIGGLEATAMGGYCDHFTRISSAGLGVQDGVYLDWTNSWIITHMASSTVQEFKDWLATHPTTIYYAYRTHSTTTEITDETLLSQLNFLASLYKGANNISLVGTGVQGEMEVFIRDVMSVETDVVPEVPVRLTLTDDGVINACGCRRNVQLTMRETTE